MDKITIADDVIATIAGVAVQETPGVVGVSAGITEGIMKSLQGKQLQKGISVESTEDSVSLDVRVVVEYGVNIPSVAKNLQKNIKNAIESMTGLILIAANIFVEGISLKNENKTYS